MPLDTSKKCTAPLPLSPTAALPESMSTVTALSKNTPPVPESNFVTVGLAGLV